MKLTDDICKRFLSLKKRIKRAEAEVSDLRSDFIHHGDWIGNEYAMTVEDGEKRWISIEAVVKHFGVTEKKLEQMGVIQKSAFKTVKVTERA